MKPVYFLGLLLALLGGAPAHGASSSLPREFLFGRDYIRADDWARANGGTAKWTVPRQEIQVTLPSGSFKFTVDSRRAIFRGTEIWLSAPVAFRNGSAHIGHIDLVSALNPLLNPSRSVGSRPVKNIVIDPGHGGKDPGNQEGKRQEKQFTLAFAKDLGELLTKAGFNVSLTRSTDTFIDLPVRPEIARRRRADLLISIHFNSADSAGAASVKGVETYCMTPFRASSTNARGEGAGAGVFPGNRFDALNMLLAFQIQKAITEKTGAEDRGVKRARFAVLRGAEMPAAYIEGGFMTNPVDAKRIYDPGLRRQMAQAVVDGVLAYKRIVDRK